MFDPMGRQAGQMPMTSYAGNNALGGFANKQYPDGRLVSQPRPQGIPGGMKQPMQPQPYLPNTGGWTPPQIGGGPSPYAPQGGVEFNKRGLLTPQWQTPQFAPGEPPPGMQSALAQYGQAGPMTFSPQGLPQQFGDFRQQLNDWRDLRPDRPDFRAMRGTEGFDPRQARQDWRGQMQDWRGQRPQWR
jgi:hypothetical protein